MGEYADMILDGLVCQECGTIINNECDVPGYCDDCANRVRDRAAECIATFEEARQLAELHGFVLKSPMAAVYQLRHAERKWIYNLYPKPGKPNPRIYSDVNHKGPFLRVPQQWTLLEVVQAAVKALAEVTNNESQAALD